MRHAEQWGCAKTPLVEDPRAGGRKVTSQKGRSAHAYGAPDARDKGVPPLERRGREARRRDARHVARRPHPLQCPAAFRADADRAHTPSTSVGQVFPIQRRWLSAARVQPTCRTWRSKLSLKTVGHQDASGKPRPSQSRARGTLGMRRQVHVNAKGQPQAGIHCFREGAFRSRIESRCVRGVASE